MPGLLNRIRKAVKTHSEESRAKKVSSTIKKMHDIESGIDKEIDAIYSEHSKPDAEIEAYFRTLGIRPTKDKSAIRKAYIVKAKDYHPDVSRIKNAEELMKGLNEAYSALMGKERLYAEHEIDEGRSVAMVEKKFIQVYSKVRDNDFEVFRGAVRHISSKDEFAGLVYSFTDWNSRFMKVRSMMFRGILLREKKLDKAINSCRAMLEKENDEEKAAQLRSCIEEATESMRKVKRFDSIAEEALQNAKAKIALIEQEQKERLYKAIT